MNQSLNPAIGYFEGLFMAAFGISLFCANVAEWQIDVVKESASKLKEAEIDHTPLSYTEKEELKRQWKQWLDACSNGFKDLLRQEGRLQ